MTSISRESEITLASEVGSDGEVLDLSSIGNTTLSDRDQLEVRIITVDWVVDGVELLTVKVTGCNLIAKLVFLGRNVINRSGKRSPSWETMG